MIMFKVLAVSNRKLCSNNFLEQIEKIAAAKPSGIILREKDLTEHAYEKLALKVIEICKSYQVPCILHTFVNVARNLGYRAIHLPISVLQKEFGNLHEFDTIGSSVHSVDEAMQAEKLGASYIMAGHIFTTNCKKGLMPKGYSFLMNIINAVRIPVYAIGGISPEKANEVVNMGVKGVCIMSGFMQCLSPLEYLMSFRIDK